jgi:hypothetical protein
MDVPHTGIRRAPVLRAVIYERAEAGFAIFAGISDDSDHWLASVLELS